MNQSQIKGKFLNHYVAEFQKDVGAEKRKDLEKGFGKSLQFENEQKYDITDELKMLKSMVHIIQPNLPVDQQDYEAGRLENKYLMNAPFIKTILETLPKKGYFKYAMQHIATFADQPFEGMVVKVEEHENGDMEIVWDNMVHSSEFLRGVFSSWLELAKIEGSVVTEQLSPQKIKMTMHFI